MCACACGLASWCAPDAGVWLRVSATANRRNRFIDVEEQFIADDGGSSR